MGIFFFWTIINSFINGYLFATTLFEIYLIRPIVYIALFKIITKDEEFHFLINSLVVITLMSALYNFLALLGAIGIIPQFLPEDETLTVISSDFFTVRTGNITALMFLTPFISTLFMFKNEIKGVNHHFVNVAFFVAFIVSVLSGRRALQVVTLLAVAVLLIMRIISAKTWKKFISVLFILLIAVVVIFVIFRCVSSYLGFDIIHAIRSTIMAAFDTHTSGSVREMQTYFLIKNWKEKPILGWGLSAYAKDYKRRNTWSYEHFYIALLFQIGLLGIAVICMYLGNIFKNIIKCFISDNDKNIKYQILAILIGGFGFLLAGATNPMVTSSWFWLIIFMTYHYSTRRVKAIRGKFYVCGDCNV